MKLIDMTGWVMAEHGVPDSRATVLYRVDDVVSPCGSKSTMWQCRCECGKEFVTSGVNLRNGHTKSCGCYITEKLRASRTTHHETGSRLYHIWQGMKSRCYNPHNKRYKTYGARGIKVCDEWRDSYGRFMEWALKTGYDDSAKRGEYTIERKDTNSDYSPSNCTWLTIQEQASNKTTNINITANGVTHNMTEWADILGTTASTICQRLKRGWDEIEAVTVPIGSMRHGK